MAASSDVLTEEELDELYAARQEPYDEYIRLDGEVKELERRVAAAEEGEEKKKMVKELTFKRANKELAGAKYNKAGNLYLQRRSEKEKSGNINYYKDEVKRWEDMFQQRKQQLLELEQEEERQRERELEERRNRQLLEEGLKRGSVLMRYLVCITIGLPGVGKTCLKYLLMGEPPPELRNSTILSESPVRIEVSIRKISEMKLRSSGERWVEVDDEDMMEIVGALIILFAEQYPESMKFLADSEAVVIEELDDTTTAPDVTEHTPAKPAPKASLLQRFVNWIGRSKPEHDTPPPSEQESKSPSTAEASHHQVSLDSSAACRKAVDTIMGRLVETIKRLKNAPQSSEVAVPDLRREDGSIPKSDWVLFSDCGGQPKYHELLPLFVRHIAAALCVLRLPDNLDKVQAVEYYSEDKPICLPAQSQLSAKDTIKCLVNTVQSFSSEHQKPKLIFVGTHLDELQKKESSNRAQASTIESATQAESHQHLETLQEKNEVLINMLESEYSDHLVYHSKDMKQLIFPVNTLERGARELAMARLIRRAVECSPARQVEVPVWWFIFEMLLQELAKQLKRKVLKKAECLQLACMLGFGARELEAVLQFFDQLNVIKYSPKVLPNVVFADSQTPLDKVSEYIRVSYLVRGGASTLELADSDLSPTEGKMKYFRDHGVITLELMREFPLHFVEGVFNEKDLSKLLVDLLIFTPIPTPPWDLKEESQPPKEEAQPVEKPQHKKHSKAQKELEKTKESEKTKEPKKAPIEASGEHFIMASSLVSLSEAELAQHRIPSNSVATLLVKFPKGQRRAGVFCCFASHLIHHCGWNLLLDAKVPLYRNCIKLHPRRISPPVTVTVIDSSSFIEVHASICQEATDLERAGLLPILKGSVFGGITAACRTLHYKDTHPELGFFCPHHEATEHSLHSASVRSNMLYWCCDVDTTVSGRLRKRHHLWYGKATVPDPQLLPEAHSRQQTSTPPPQGSPATNAPIVKIPASADFEGISPQRMSTAAISTVLRPDLPPTPDQSSRQSSRNAAPSQTASSAPLLQAHCSMSSPAPHPPKQSRVQLPTSTPLTTQDPAQQHITSESATTALQTVQVANIPQNLPQQHSVASAAGIPTMPDAGRLLQGTDQYSCQSILDATQFAFPPDFHPAHPTMKSSADYLPKIPELVSVRQIAQRSPTSSAGAANIDISGIQRPQASNCQTQSVSPIVDTTLQTDYNLSTTGTKHDDQPGSLSSPAPARSPPYSQKKPALHQLDMLKGSKKTIRVIDRIAHVWDRVATRLYFEGHEIKCIEQDCPKTHKASREMIMEWLEGNESLRKPVTWATLIEALDEAELSEVAKDIVSILNEYDSHAL